MAVAVRWTSLLAIAMVGMIASFSQAEPQKMDSELSIAKQNIHIMLTYDAYLGRSVYDKMDDIRNGHDGVQFAVYYPRITTSQSTSLCVEHVFLGPMTVDASRDGEQRTGVVVLNAAEFDLTWAELAAVRADGNNVMLRWQGVDRESTIIDENSDRAVALAHAIDVVRQACVSA